MDFVNSVYWGKESRPKKILQKIEIVKICPDPIDKVDLKFDDPPRPKLGNI